MNTGRDAAMESLRCVTVLNKLPFDGNGTAGIATYLHECNVTVDFEDPGANSTTISEVRMHPTVISSSTILMPGAGCVGTPPPETCYVFAGNRFIYNYQDANASPVQDGLPYRIRVNKTDGSAERFVVHPATGTIRHEDN